MLCIVNQLTQELTRDIKKLTGTIECISHLSGGITNHNYKLETSSGAYVVRVAGEKSELLGIDRQAEFDCSGMAYQLGIGAEPIAYLAAHQAILTRFLEAAQTLDTASATAQLDFLVSTLKKLHAAPAFPKSFSAFQTITQYHQIALVHGVKFPKDTPQILRQLTQIQSQLEPTAKIVPCHNDLLPSNLLFGRQLFLIDWEYAGNGNRMFDLGNLAANLELNDHEELLGLYFGEVSHQLRQELALMRCVSEAREAFWGFLQSGISSLDFDFLAYANTHLERFRIAQGG